jgi:hypothetical protein
MNQNIQCTLCVVVAKSFYTLQINSQNIFWFQYDSVTRKAEDLEIYDAVWRICDGIFMTSAVCNRDKSGATNTWFNSD